MKSSNFRDFEKKVNERKIEKINDRLQSIGTTVIEGVSLPLIVGGGLLTITGMGGMLLTGKTIIFGESNFSIDSLNSSLALFENLTVSGAIALGAGLVPNIRFKKMENSCEELALRNKFLELSSCDKDLDDISHNNLDGANMYDYLAFGEPIIENEFDFDDNFQKKKNRR